MSFKNCPSPVLRPRSLTAVMNNESLTGDETGVIRITLKLKGDLGPPGDNLETLLGPNVLSNHIRHEVLSVKNSQHVGVTDV